MRKIKLCFAGAGSIGKRHIKNAAEYLTKRNIPYQIDLLRSGAGQPLDKETENLIHRVTYDFENIKDIYDAVFVTNPTAKHKATVKEFSGKAKAFFIEKPVFHTSDIDIEDLKTKNNAIYYVACPLRYSKAIQYLKENVDFSKVINVRVVSSSFLPDWREGTDYRKTYSAIKKLGGGVSIDLIHEWDYITYLIGMPKQVYSIISKVSDLEIDSDDIAVYIAEYQNKVVELHLDYFTKIHTRKILIQTNEEIIEADLIEGWVKYFYSGVMVDVKEARNDIYRKETEHFFDIIWHGAKNDNDVCNALKVLRLAEGKRK